MRKNIFYFLLCSLWLFSCKKNHDESPKEEIYGDGLSKEDNEYLESHSIPTPTLQDLLGYDDQPLGRTMAREESELINSLIRDAQALCAQKIILHPDEGPNKPGHYGLVYSYGQRDLTQRLFPPFGNALHKKYAVFGTDCSGFMLNILAKNGILIQNTNVAGFEAALKSALKSHSTLNKIEVRNLNWQPIDKIQTGDIIIWGTKHVGIVSKTTGSTKVMLQSNGNDQPGDETEQTKNLGHTRGANVINLTTAISGSGYWGTGYKILRLIGGLNISNPSNYPVTQQLGTVCGGYVIADFTCSEADWNSSLGRPTFKDANGNTKIVNGALLQNITNNWGFPSTSCTSSSSNAVIFYNTTIANGTVSGKVKVLGDFGNLPCSPPYSNTYFLSFKFTLINSSLSGDMQTNYAGTYTLASNFLTTSQ